MQLSSVFAHIASLGASHHRPALPSPPQPRAALRPCSPRPRLRGMRRSPPRCVAWPVTPTCLCRVSGSAPSHCPCILAACAWRAGLAGWPASLWAAHPQAQAHTGWRRWQHGAIGTAAWRVPAGMPPPGGLLVPSGGASPPWLLTERRPASPLQATRAAPCCCLTCAAPRKWAPLWGRASQRKCFSRRWAVVVQLAPLLPCTVCCLLNLLMPPSLLPPLPAGRTPTWSQASSAAGRWSSAAAQTRAWHSGTSGGRAGCGPVGGRRASGLCAMRAVLRCAAVRCLLAAPVPSAVPAASLQPRLLAGGPAREGASGAGSRERSLPGSPPLVATVPDACAALFYACCRALGRPPVGSATADNLTVLKVGAGKWEGRLVCMSCVALLCQPAGCLPVQPAPGAPGVRCVPAGMPADSALLRGDWRSAAQPSSPLPS